MLRVRVHFRSDPADGGMPVVAHYRALTVRGDDLYLPGTAPKDTTFFLVIPYGEPAVGPIRKVEAPGTGADALRALVAELGKEHPGMEGAAEILKDENV